MYLDELDDLTSDLILFPREDGPTGSLKSRGDIPVTVHKGGNKWEDVVDVVYCHECNQYHIICNQYHIITEKTDNPIKEHSKMAEVQNNIANIQANLKGAVTTLLVTQYDWSIEESEVAVNKSFEKFPDMWHENATSKDLAKTLATDDDDE